MASSLFRINETKSNYNWSTYKWCNGAYNKLTKYCPADKTDYWDVSGSPDNKIVLDLEDDAARTYLGDKWRMPSDKEWTALRNECTWTWTTVNRKHGYYITAANGNSIFLPAAGYRLDSDLDNAGSDGNYWSSSLYTDGPYYAWYVYFYSSNVSRNYGSRYYGFSVRPVSE